ncbi:hypothetical protein M9Y10_021783 [Tritrichomonas musculus]|uniref:Ankyrin repeat protein n=1 Tax=Tritrichomonas musculus TaxID=1915356 RepID=A0ABR2KQQ1_9EUKA
MSDKKIVEIIQNNDIGVLAKNIGKIKVNAHFKLSVNEFSNISDERTDNFKNDQITLLHVAAFFDSLECFCYLLPKFKYGLRTQSVKAYYPLHYACFNGSREIAVYILKKEPQMAAETPPNIDHHFIYYTIFGGDPIILTELFENGAELDDKRNMKDDPIGKAIDLCQIPCLEVLLKYEKRMLNQEHFTPAMLAAKNCHPEALKILVRSSDELAYFSPTNQSVISLIFYYSNGGMFKDVLIDLLKKYPNIRIEPPDEIVAPGVCHWLCKVCNKELAELMVETREVNINRVDDQFHTGPFNLSLRRDLKDDDIIAILKIIIGHGFDINYRPNNRSEILIEYFINAMLKRKKVIEFILSQGVNLDVPSFKFKNMTIFEQVMSSNDKDLKRIFETYHR